MERSSIWKCGRCIALAPAAALMIMLAGCGGSEETAAPESEPVTVFAAASTSRVMEEIIGQFEREYGVTVEANFASSGSLVQQMQHGNAADLFISASINWMDTACDEGLMETDTRIDLLGNRLVLVSPVADPAEVSLDDAGWWEPFTGIIAMGDPAHVPAGAYGMEALEYYGCADELVDRLSNSASVTAALMLVETGQTPIGIVYENNAVMSEKVIINASFPAESHRPIVYPAALGADAPAGAEQLFRFLRGPYARSMFEAYGFLPLTDMAMPGDDAALQPHAWFSSDDVSPTIIATLLSLKVALASVLFLLVPCIGMGWLLAKKDFPGKHILSALVQVPLVIPPVATGYLLLVILGTNSGMGGWLASHLGISLSFNWIAVVIASSVVSMPLLVKSVRVAMENVDPHIEDAANTLGKGPLATFLLVTLPLSWHGIVAGGILCFSRAMGEFGATITYAGNIAGKTRTIPLATFNYIQSPGGDSQAMALIFVSIAVSVGSVAVVEWLTAGKRHAGLR